MAIKNLDIERHCLSAVLRYPKIIADVMPFIREEDFSNKVHRTVFGVMLFSAQKQEEISPLMIAERIKNAGAGFTKELEGGGLLDYLQELSLTQVTEVGGVDFFKELKTLAIRREIIAAAQDLINEIEKADSLSAEDVIQLAEEAMATKVSSFSNVVGQDFSNIYESLEEIMEEIGNNPRTEFGMMGPFKRVNEIYGSLLRPGNICLIGARQNVGKTSLGHFYLTKVADKYEVPLLHLDAGEMTEFELQLRTVTMLTDGKVPMFCIERGTWRQNEIFVKLVRDAWAKIRTGKSRCYYKGIGGLSPKEIVSVIRRFYVSVVGSGNQFVTHYDYLKSFESFGVNSPEWQQMGYFVQMLKTLITSKSGVPTSIWTSLQLNKGGIIGNKTSATLDDTENTFSVSDRIIQQVSHAFLFRNKTMEELADYPKHGECNLINVKKRHLGEDYESALTPVRMPDGSLRPNYIHIKSRGFCFDEMGDLASAVNTGGVLMNDNYTNADDDAPPPDVPRASSRDDADLVA